MPDPAVTTPPPALLDAADRILTAEGVAGLTTDRLAAVSGLSSAEVNRWAPDVPATARLLIDRYLEMFIGAFEAVGGQNRPLEELIEVVTEAMLSTYQRRAASIRALWLLRGVADVEARIRDHQDHMTAGLAALLRSRGMQAEHATSFAFVVTHGADGIANAIAVRDSADARRASAIYASMVRAYLVGNLGIRT
ncbi:MAG: TetR/AcrR family transcriptional regulator [Kofleriaceae bacterium]|nr:TetR/AcrR family transcriptional regulator [Kofleriaceae bacterium]